MGLWLARSSWVVLARLLKVYKPPVRLRSKACFLHLCLGPRSPRRVATLWQIVARARGLTQRPVPLGGRKLLCRFVPLGSGLKAVNARVAAVASPGNAHSRTAMKRTCHRWAADPLFGQHCASGKAPFLPAGSSRDGWNLKASGVNELGKVVGSNQGSSSHSPRSGVTAGGMGGVCGGSNRPPLKKAPFIPGARAGGRRWRSVRDRSLGRTMV